MMSNETVISNTHSQTYDKLAQKKDENTSSKKVPSTSSSPPPPYNGPLIIEKPNLDLILRPPKNTLQKYVFNRNAQATQFYNVVEDLAQAPCVKSTLQVLQSFPTQRKNLLTSLGSLDTDNTNLIHFNVENYKSKLPYHLMFQIVTRVVGRKVHRTILDEGDSTSVLSVACWRAIGSPKPTKSFDG